MDLFGLAEHTSASELYARYTEYRETVGQLNLAAPMREAFLALLNRAYDEALTQTVEVVERAMSPRAPRFSED